jgi:hypothetical protein
MADGHSVQPYQHEPLASVDLGIDWSSGSEEESDILPSDADDVVARNESAER